MKIQWKLLVVLLLPLLALAAVVGVEVLDRRAEADEAQRARQVVELVGTGNDLRDGVQLQVALAALPQTNDVARRLRTAQLETEADIRTFNMALGSFDLGEYGPGFATAVEEVETALRNYEAASPRARTDETLARALTTALVDELGGAAARTITGDGELARAALGYTSLLVANERRAGVFYRVTQAVSEGPATRQSLRRIGAQEAEEQVALEIFRSTATSGQREDLASVGRDRTAGTAESAIEAVQRTPIGSPITLDTQSFVPAMERRIRLLESFTRSVGRDIEEDASTTRDAAARSALVYLAVGIAAIVLAFGLAIAFLISIVRRLNQLTDGAHYFAERQLPAIVESLRDPKATEAVLGESIVLERLGSDEIGEVGRAFNSVQESFAGVVRDHADLLRKGIGDIFVKLARRNQSLVERQIELLDELEAAEKDPDVLENLFKLDHLATRVRRNAESLLVLAGSEPTRRWSQPVPLDELLQGAMSEIEDYRRIQVASGSAGNTVEIVGAASLDIAHLFAELLDNAVRFSPSDTMVEVLVRRRGEDCLVYVSDTGMGMTDEQLDEANELLEDPPEPGLDLSRTLGLYVAARLAERHNIAVRLARSAYDGVVASVTLPPSLVVDVPVAEPPAADPAFIHELADGSVTIVGMDDDLPQRVEPVAPAVVSHEQRRNGDLAAAEALPQRVQALPNAAAFDRSDAHDAAERPHGAAPSQRSPDERRHQLSSFLRKLDEGRRPASEGEPDSAEEHVS